MNNFPSKFFSNFLKLLATFCSSWQLLAISNLSVQGFLKDFFKFYLAFLRLNVNPEYIKSIQSHKELYFLKNSSFQNLQPCPAFLPIPLVIYRRTSFPKSINTGLSATPHDFHGCRHLKKNLLGS